MQSGTARHIVRQRSGLEPVPRVQHYRRLHRRQIARTAALAVSNHCRESGIAIHSRRSLVDIDLGGVDLAALYNSQRAAIAGVSTAL